MVRKVKCVDVFEFGDEDEFSDLIDVEGELQIDPNDTDRTLNWFNGGAGVNFVDRLVTEENGLIMVGTRWGNTFTFELV